ncbi:MAG: hypothetical protein EBR82_80145, partial [Caulobacteraceae bacterium]|nr:hypothetical protein [Caulobacteraceae bacterium]
PSDIITDPSSGVKYIYDNGEFVRLDSGLKRASFEDFKNIYKTNYGEDLDLSDTASIISRYKYMDPTTAWSPATLAIDIALEAGIDPKVLFKSDGTLTHTGDAVFGVATDSASQFVNNINGVANMMGFKNTWLNQKAQELSAYADKTRPWEIDDETSRFYNGLKAIKDSGSWQDVAAYIGQFAVDHPRFTAFNVASEILQEFPQLLAGGAFMKGAELLKFAPQIASKLGITVDAVMEIGESMGSQYNSEFTQARQALEARVKSGELTADQADAMARDTAVKSGLIAGGVTGFISTTPAGKALTKSVLTPEMGTVQNQVKDNLAKELLARGWVTGKVGALEATSEGLEEGGISALIQLLNSDKPFSFNDVVANTTYGAIVGGGTGGSISLGANVTDILQNAGVRSVDTEQAAAQVRDAAKTGLGVGQAKQRFA